MGVSSMKFLFLLALVFLPFTLCSEEDVGMYDLPPVTSAQLDAVREAMKIPVWTHYRDNYGPVGSAAKMASLQEALAEEAPQEEEKTNISSSSDNISASEEGEDSEQDEQEEQEEQEEQGGEEEAEGTEEEAPPSDLVDVEVDSLLHDGMDEEQQEHDLRPREQGLPAVLAEDPSITEMRSAMIDLRRKLQPLHRRVCRRSFSSCLARRRANVAILKNLVRRRCHVRARGCSVRRAISAPRRRRIRSIKRCKTNEYGDSECGASEKEVGELRRVSRVYTYLQHVYSRLYIRYALMVARYYRRKFKTLTQVFMQTVKQLKWEAKKVNGETAKLRSQLATLREESKKMRDRTYKQHDDHKKKLSGDQKKLLDEQARINRNAEDVKAELMKEKGATMRLQQQLDDLNAKIRKEEDDKKRAADDKARVEQESKNLAEANKKLLDQIGTLQAKLDESRSRVRNLEKLQDALNAQLRATREILNKINSEKDSTDRARERIQSSYNSLQQQLNGLLNNQKSAADRQQAAIADLRAQIAQAKKRCVPDACGVCNGDESTCAYTRGNRMCYSVGDPHLVTFDGVAYDYQHDGQFVYVWHGNPVNFELQITQSPVHWGAWPRLNRGLAIRAGREVVVAYASWQTSAVLINNRRVDLPMGQWQRVGPGLTLLRQNEITLHIRYEAAGQIVAVMAHLYRFNYADIFITAPWQWSSGRSLFGLCGDFDAWSANDMVWIGRNAGRIIAVTNQRRDLFRFPERRTSLLELVDHTTEEIEEQQKWDKLNNVAQPEDLKDYTGEDLELPENIYVLTPESDLALGAANATQPSATQAALANAGKAGGKGVKPAFGPATPRMEEEAHKRCRGSHGEARKQCMTDILWGMRGNDTRKEFQEANILSNERLLKRCMVVDSKHFAMFSAAKLPPIETAKEGVSVAFWYNPDSLSSSRCILLEKGRDFFITQDGSDLAVGAGPLSCTASNVFTAGNWSAVTAVVHHTRGLQVFVNDRAACAMSFNSTVFAADDIHDDLLAGGADSKTACSGRLAHLYYIPQTVTRKEVTVHGQLKPFACQRPRNDTRTTL